MAGVEKRPWASEVYLSRKPPTTAVVVLPVNKVVQSRWKPWRRPPEDKGRTGGEAGGTATFFFASPSMTAIDNSPAPNFANGLKNP